MLVEERVVLVGAAAAGADAPEQPKGATHRAGVASVDPEVAVSLVALDRERAWTALMVAAAAQKLPQAVTSSSVWGRSWSPLQTASGKS